MNRILLLIALLILTTSPMLFAGSKTSYSDLVLKNESNPTQSAQARILASSLDLPLRIYLPTGVVMEPLSIEDNKPVYAIITNLAHPFIGGSTAFFEEIQDRYDLASARILYRNKSYLSHTTPRRSGRENLLSEAGLLLVPDWTADKVLAFDPLNGNLVNSNFIPSTPGHLQSPKEALMSPWGFITVSDQISDLVQKFDTSGAYLGWFAPASGVNNSILDNIRGHAYRPNRNLVVTVASGSNANSIAEFDSGGNYIGNFIAVGAGGLNSPFGILFRSNDVLVSQSSGSPTGVRSYDLNGAFQSVWASISSFPQQVVKLSDNRIAVANFSGTGSTGIRLYAPDGTFLRLLSGVTGNRGVYQLANGNFLTTNGAGIHEVDSSSGSLVRTIMAAANLQYITLYVPASGAPTFTVSPSNINAGTVCVGASRRDSVMVTNSGTAPLSVSSVISTDTSFSATPTSATIPAGDNRRFYLTFSPVTAGTRTGAIVFNHNASGSPDSVVVHGIGNLPPSPFDLVAPPNGDTSRTGLAVQFRWRRPDGPVPSDTVIYGMDYSTSGGAMWLLVSNSIRDTQFVFTIPNTPGPALWRVSAAGFCGFTFCVTPFWFIIDPTANVENRHSEKPDDFSLSPNYPNPFNPVTTIRYAIPTVSYVTIRIYNVFGQEVVTLTDGVRPAGYYELRWNGTNTYGVSVGSGIYVCRIRAGGFVQSRKLVLLR